MFSFMRMQTSQRARNVWKLNSQISQDGTFVHYSFFYCTFLYLLQLSLIGIVFRHLFVLTYFHSSRRHTHTTTHATGKQIVRAKMTSLDAIFCRGNKSSFRSLARFCRRKHKNLPLALRARDKIWALLVGKSRVNAVATSVSCYTSYARFAKYHGNYHKCPCQLSWEC